MRTNHENSRDGWERRGHNPLRHGPHAHGGPGFRRMAGARRRQRRGDVRAAVLVLLDEAPRNGYQLMQAIEERSGGAWRPSPGSIYPVLSQLEDEGLVASESDDHGRRFALTASGRADVTANRERYGKPWEAAAAEVGESRFELMRTIRQLIVASRQVLEAGDDAQVQRVGEILHDARKKIYAILGE